MTDYYTTSERWKAELAILHGLEGCESTTVKDFYVNGCNEGFTPCEINCNSLIDCVQWRFPKTPHNVGLEAHRENDICKQILPSGFTMLGIVEKDSDDNLYVDWGGGEDYDLSTWTIIERNNKPRPVWDEERVCP